MVNYLAVGNICDDGVGPQLGGGAFLPPDVPWPCDENGREMLHLLSLPGGFLTNHTNITVDNSMCVSVFIPYSKDSVEESISLARRKDAAHVLVYEPGNLVRQQHGWPLQPCRILDVDPDEEAIDDDEFSDEIENKIGGIPVWLQDRIDYAGMEFCLQLVGGTIKQFWPSHSGIFLGGVGYLFLKPEIPSIRGGSELCGSFRIQYS